MATIQIGAPDGSVVEFPDGTPDAVIKSVMQKSFPSAAPQQPSQQQPAPQQSGPPDRGILGTVDDYVRAAANGITFGLADRFAAGMGSVTGIGGKAGDYDTNLKTEQAKTDRFASEQPIGNIAAQTAGGIASFPLTGAANALRGASLGGKVLTGAGIGAGYGGLQGAFSSKDMGNSQDVAQNTAIGMGTGGVIGAAAPAVGAAVGAVGRGIANAFTPIPQGMSRAGSQHLMQAARADTVPALQAEMSRLGPDAMMLDAGPAMLGKAQGAALLSDEARSTLSNALKPRDLATNQRISGDISRALGPAEDPYTVTEAIKAYRSKVDGIAYPAALDNGPAVKVAPILTEIDAAIPKSVGMERKALSNLRDMLMTTKKQPRLDADGRQVVDSRGNPVFDTVKVSQNDPAVLHKVKTEIDNVIQYDGPGLGVPAGALTRQQATLKKFRFELNDAIERQVPGYMKANRQSESLAKRGTAVDLGTQYLGSQKTTPSPGRFAAAFDPLSQGEKIAFAKGSRGEIERLIGTKANDLQALKNALQGEGGWNTAKLATVHGRGAVDQLVGSVDRNLKFRDSFSKVVENSQTAQRKAAANTMKASPSELDPIITSGTTTFGAAATLAKRVVAKALLKKDQTAGFGEVARILTSQGAERDAYFKALTRALRRESAGTAAAEKADRAATILSAMGANAYSRDLLKQK